jgi:signal transduction histidine kinase/ActR/RegA family two-component response regulator
MGGLFFLGLYRFGRHDKVILFFAMFCLAYIYRIVGTNNYVLHQLLPDLSWHVSVRLEYFTLFISILFFCFYTLQLYPRETDGWVVRMVVIINGSLAALVLITPPVIFTRTINVFLVLMFAFTFYIFWVYLKAYRNKILGSGYALWSTAVVLLVMLLINFQYFGVFILDRAVLFVGYILFFFLQSLILSYRFAERLNIARWEAEKALRAKSEFLSTMSHEIRTPLNSVIGMTHILLKDKPRADQQEQLNVLLFAARNLLSIVNDILDYNKIEAGKISMESIPVDIAALSKNIFLGLRSQGDEKGLEMRIEINHSFNNKLLTDPTRLSQVLVNLLHNAIKFTKEGSVCLRVSMLERQEQKMCVRFEVVDTGIGIAIGKQQLIFERFTQADSSTSRSYGGTGLGLSIARRILEYQGSQLLLESEQDKGSRFYFDLWLPESSELVPDSAQSKLDYLDDDQQGKPLQGLDILLVEDNALNVMVAKAFLQRWGANIEVATNGAEALTQMKAQKHGLVLMDLHMPVMDGYEATRKLRERGEKVAIIALTASLPKEVEHDAFSAGVDAVVVKPFNPDDLRKTILEILLAKGTRFGSMLNND